MRLLLTASREPLAAANAMRLIRENDNRRPAGGEQCHARKSPPKMIALNQQIGHDLGGLDASQFGIESLKFDGKSIVIHSELVQQGGVEIMD